jgi:hypothetical protein
VEVPEPLMAAIEQVSFLLHGDAGSGLQLLPGAPHYAGVSGFAHDLVFLQLSGAHEGTPPWWIDPFDDPFADGPQSALAPVYAGLTSEGALFVDLAQTPEAIAVHGHPEALGELLAEFANRCCHVAERGGRLAVAVAGEPFAPELLLGAAITAPSLAAFDPCTLPRAAEACLLFCAPTAEPDRLRIEELTRFADVRIVPIVASDTFAAAWTLVVRRGITSQ